MTATSGLPDLSPLAADDTAILLSAVEELSQLRDLQGVMAVVRRHARTLTKADGVTFVLREGQQVFYADEDAIAPLWKGRRFPIDACVSGWAMIHRQVVVIADVYEDERVPITAYHPTFVKSMLMVPIGRQQPIGAIGAYWASKHQIDSRERTLLEALAGFTATAVANAQLYQEARDAVRARDQWMGIASHELRTPLTPMKLQLEGIHRAIERGINVADLQPRIQRGMRSLERLTRLVEQLLDYTRLSHGALVLQPQCFDLGEVAREVCDRFRENEQSQPLPLTFDCGAPVHGVWDPVRVDELLTNLISNAVKYGRASPVRVEVAGSGSGARLVVEDRGVGIRPQDRERIFQPFTRLADSGQGIGLGLWIVRQIVQAHGGTVDVQGEEGKGTTFVVVLPSIPAQAPAPLKLL